MILGIRTIRRSLLVALAFSIPALAKCPVTDGTTVFVKAAAGDLIVDTNTREPAADVQVDNSAVQIQETCGKDLVQFISTSPIQARGPVTWKIIIPKGVHLDLTTMAGNITVPDVDGNAVLRTAGGSITAGRIKGRASLITQGGSIKSGNIGGDAELRSQGGTLDVGDIGGNAELYATAGIIRAGNVTGSVNAEGGRLISIVKASDVKATSKAGDISIGDASRINAKSGGGSITSKRVRGPFQGHTDAGDIRLESAASWVEASTAQGNIYVRLVPDDYDGDLHMNLDAGTGDITVYLPPRLRASLDASVQRAAFQSQQIISDFPKVPDRPPAQGLIPTIPNRFYGGTHWESVLNGGDNKIVLHTGLGKITIRRN